MDKVMYAFLGAAIVLGMWNTIAGSIFSLGGEYNYREGVSVWYRSFLAFQPDAALMADAPIGFQLHALVAFGLFALWPFTRLVHVFSAPIGYLTRPYVVYRSRDDRPLGNAAPRRGWDRVG
jgi:nitrate reductase gamma subunit